MRRHARYPHLDILVPKVIRCCALPRASESESESESERERELLVELRTTERERASERASY
jgi:hypothetical protein